MKLPKSSVALIILCNCVFLIQGLRNLLHRTKIKNQARKLVQFKSKVLTRRMQPEIMPDTNTVLDTNTRNNLAKYGMLTAITYDVFNGDDDVDEHSAGFSLADKVMFDNIHGESLKKFNSNGLKFAYLKKNCVVPTVEYDFRDEYEIIQNIYTPAYKFWLKDVDGRTDVWAGYVAISKEKQEGDGREVIFAWRGTIAPAEWICDLKWKPTDWDDGKSKINLFNRNKVLVHDGFYDLYTHESAVHGVSPKDFVTKTLDEIFSMYENVEKISIVGHSLGGALATLNGFHIMKDGINRGVPVSIYSYASPCVGNKKFKEVFKSFAPVLQHFRVFNIKDIVPTPKIGIGIISQFRHASTMDVELNSDDLVSKGIMEDRVGKFKDVGPRHNLEVYLKLIDMSRDNCLLNRSDSVLTKEMVDLENATPCWGLRRSPRVIHNA